MFHKSTRTSKSTNHRFHPGIGGLSAIAALFVALVALATASVQGDGSHQTALARSSKCQSARVGNIYARQCSPSGRRGPRGLTGPRGPIGPTGLTGPAGPLGAKGETGPAGAQGPACSSSDPACKGPKGDKGDACSSSDPACKGPKGDACSSSDPACKGPKGDACSSSDPACKGPKGDPGPSDLYASKVRDGPDLKNFTNTDVLSLAVPAGSYLVTARVNLFNFNTDSQGASCKLSTDTGGTQESRRLAGGGADVYMLQDAETFFSPTKIILQCSSFDAATEYARLAAIKVGTLH